MPCIDHDYKNCPAYMELGDGEHCKINGCLRHKAILETSASLFEATNADLESIVIAGKTGGRQGTI